MKDTTNVTDIRALLYTCRYMEPIITQLCRSKIPHNCIINPDSNGSEDIKNAVFWSFLQQVPSSGIFAGSFPLWLFESTEERRKWMPNNIDVFFYNNTLIGQSKLLMLLLFGKISSDIELCCHNF